MPRPPRSFAHGFDPSSPDDVDAAVRELLASDCVGCGAPSTIFSTRLVTARKLNTAPVIELELIVPLCDACHGQGEDCPGLRDLAVRALTQAGLPDLGRN